MKVIKLDRRHRLHRLGFAHAFKFEDGFKEDRHIILNLERTLEAQYGLSNEKNVWKWQWNSRSTNGNRVYYIGVRNEAIVTQLLMML
jgi:hypothetical protein